jgi:hypothetical protein
MQVRSLLCGYRGAHESTLAWSWMGGNLRRQGGMSAGCVTVDCGEGKGDLSSTFDLG